MEVSNTLLSENQAQTSKSDVELTRLIWKELTNDKLLSVYAQNIKFITIHGNVTLRGPVHTNKEKKNPKICATNCGSRKDQ
jgi:hyperosmotically inducible protein